MRRPDLDGVHCCDLRVTQRKSDAKASEAVGHHRREPVRKCANVPGRRNDREQRAGAYEKKQRLAIDHESVNIPVAKRGVGRSGILRYGG